MGKSKTELRQYIEKSCNRLLQQSMAQKDADTGYDVQYGNEECSVLLLPDKKIYEEIQKFSWKMRTAVHLCSLEDAANTDAVSEQYTGQSIMKKAFNVLFAVSNEEPDIPDRIAERIPMLKKILEGRSETLHFYSVVMRYERTPSTDEYRKLFVKLQKIEEIEKIVYMGDYYSNRKQVSSKQHMEYLEAVCMAIAKTDVFEQKTQHVIAGINQTQIDVIGFKHMKISDEKFFWVSLQNFYKQIAKRTLCECEERKNMSIMQSICAFITQMIQMELPDMKMHIPCFENDTANICQCINLADAEEQFFGLEMNKLTNQFKGISSELKKQLVNQVSSQYLNIEMQQILLFDIEKEIHEDTLLECLEQEIKGVNKSICHEEQKIIEEYASNHFTDEYLNRKKKSFFKNKETERVFLQNYLEGYVYLPMQKINRLHFQKEILEELRQSIQEYECEAGRLKREWAEIQMVIQTISDQYVNEGTDFMNAKMQEIIDELVAHCVTDNDMFEKIAYSEQMEDWFESIFLKKFAEKVWSRINYLFTTPEQLFRLKKFSVEQYQEEYINELLNAEKRQINMPIMNIGAETIRCNEEKYYYANLESNDYPDVIIKKCQGIDTRNLL